MPPHHGIPPPDATSASASAPLTGTSYYRFTSPLKPRGTHVQGILDVTATAKEKTTTSARPSQMSVNAAATDPQKQQQLKHQVMQELRALTFEDSTILHRFIEIKEQQISLAHRALKSLNPRAASQRSLGSFFARNSGEDEAYEPFVRVFNTIGEAYHESTSSKLAYIPLQVYTRSTRDGVDGAAALKPDLIGAIDNNVGVSSTGRYRWGEIGIAGEVKDSWSELVAQAGTYGRAILNAHPTRTFALVVGFNHNDKNVRFLFFHRGGLHSTLPFKLTTKNGVTNFIHGVIVATALQHGHSGLSWTLPAQALRTSAAQKPSAKQSYPFRTDECVYRRVPMTGRCTAGWTLELDHHEASATTEASSVPGLSVQPKQAAGIITRSKNRQRLSALNPSGDPRPTVPSTKLQGKRKRAHKPLARSSKRQRSPKRQKAAAGGDASYSKYTNSDQQSFERLAQDDAFCEWFETYPLNYTDSKDPPERLFSKDAWAPKGHVTEAGVHQLMFGEFGAPDLWAHQVLDSNEFFYQENDSLNDWHIFIDRAQSTQAFHRNVLVHSAMYFSTIGVPLHEAKTPLELLVPVLHAMLGEQPLAAFTSFNMLTQSPLSSLRNV